MSSLLTRRRFVARAGVAAVLTAGAGIALDHRPPAAGAARSTAIASPAPAPQSLLVLRMEITGGFVPAEYALTELPAFSLYADGTVITTGPMIEIFPRPALPNLRRFQLTPAGIDLVLEEAHAAGLLRGDTSYDNPLVADAPFTLFTTVADGRVETVSAYALGIGEEALPASPETEARAVLLEFQGFLFDLPARLPAEAISSGDEAYQIERIRIYARPIDAAIPPWAESGLEQAPMAWPLATPLSAFGGPVERADLYGEMRCGVVVDEGAQDLLAALQSANVFTPWESDGALYQLWVRPLLPDEEGC